MSVSAFTHHHLGNLAICPMTGGYFGDIVQAPQGCWPGLTFADSTTHRGT